MQAIDFFIAQSKKDMKFNLVFKLVVYTKLIWNFVWYKWNAEYNIGNEIYIWIDIQRKQKL